MLVKFCNALLHQAQHFPPISVYQKNWQSEFHFNSQAPHKLHLLRSNFKGGSCVNAFLKFITGAMEVLEKLAITKKYDHKEMCWVPGSEWN